jgi:GNAT superfamily N-acetyltransferase
MPMSSPTIDTELLPPTAHADPVLMERISELANEVYAVAEAGLWTDGATRTSVGEIVELTRAGEIAVARLAGQVVGCVRLQRLDERTSEFGMLCADPAHRGVGIGRELIRFAERNAREWTHPSKQFLAEWYSRLGYRVARTGTIEELYPELAPLLATPCDFVIYRKELTTWEP